MSGSNAPSRKSSLFIYRFLFRCVEFTVLLGFWFLLTGKANFSEFLAGALSIIVSLIAAHVCVQEPFSRFGSYSRYILEIWRVPYSVLTGLYQVLYALGLQLFTKPGASSRIQTTPFKPGAIENPEDKLRRTLALTYPCCSPNFVSIDIDHEKGLYIFHQVKPTPPPKLLTVFRASHTRRERESA